MLEIKDISKQYKTGNLIQKALDHVSLNLRESEFVAILGPSGSGKTTLLNIIGGLDRYDSGDLVINGISTKKYKDRDWDSYRNHTIGFVFQSYNLIPHQTLLANVELALTISGISRKERTKRAIAALEEVGLGEQIHKKPNQLSGGQMQRVALARALVNNPDILLADEPTGALDSQTSVQVMDLLKKVAKDRLVVMVTHNPELAEQYATRIVNLKDGVILSDSNPYQPKMTDTPPVHKNMGKSSMSFLTALSLSMNNLLTKKARTTLVAFAGSIGIIGIALILSLSTGVNAFIQKTEEDTLSEYPLEIPKQTMDLSAMIDTEKSSEEEETGDVESVNMMSRMFNQVVNNDLGSLKKYLEKNDALIDQYARSIEYAYDVEPILYQANTETGLHQVHPDTVFSSSGIAPTSSIYSSMSTNSFHQLPENAELYMDAYDLKTGKWPSKYNEIVLVLNASGRVNDVSLYVMGLRDYREYEKMVENFVSGKSSNTTTYSDQYQYEDFLGVSFKLVNPSDRYRYDSSLKMWIDESENDTYMKNLVEDGEEIKVVGVVQPKPETDILMLTAGLNYTPSLQRKVMQYARQSQIVTDQLKDTKTNVFTNEPFAEASESSFDMSSLFQFDGSALQNAFKFDTSKLSFDASAMDLSGIDFSQMNLSLPSLTQQDLLDIAGDLKIDTSKVDLAKVVNDLLVDYFKRNPQYANVNEKFTEYLNDSSEKGAFAHLQHALNEVFTQEKREHAIQVLSQMNEELINAYQQSSYYDPTAADPLSGLRAFMESEEARTILSNRAAEILRVEEKDVLAILTQLSDGFTTYAGYSAEQMIGSMRSYLTSQDGYIIIFNDLSEMMNMEDIQNQLMAAVGKKMSAYSGAMEDSIQQMMALMMKSIQDAIMKNMSGLSAQLANAFSFDASALSNLVSFDGDTDKLSAAFMSMRSAATDSYESNLAKLGYASESEPNAIVIYPKDFEAKGELKDILEAYNEDMKNSNQKSKVIIYTDLVGAMMSSVTDIVNVISYILIAFVAISLIVSSIMIGVITYISVLERQKEIGILRAIGASKRNISNVFNAETFITGLLAGLFGIGITELLLIPGNAIIHTLTDRSDVTAILPFGAAVILVGLSIVLTLIGGIIPSKKASHSDPVKALRTD